MANELSQHIEKVVLNSKDLVDLLPEGWTPKRLAALVLKYAPSWTGKNVNPASLITALKEAAICGVEPDGRRAHLVLYGNQVRFMPEYKALIDIARAAMPDIASIHCDTVHENDEWEHEEGNNPVLRHKRPRLSQPRGKLEGAYCIVRMKDGSHQATIMTAEELMQIKAMSKGSNSASSPYQNWQNEMFKKATIRRAMKLFPETPALAAAIDAENSHFDLARNQVKLESPVDATKKEQALTKPEESLLPPGEPEVTPAVKSEIEGLFG